MELSWLEISFLYLATTSLGVDIARLGFIYHDINAFGIGTLLIIYCAIRGLKSLEIWWKEFKKKKRPRR